MMKDSIYLLFTNKESLKDCPPSQTLDRFDLNENLKQIDRISSQYILLSLNFIR